MKKKFKIKSGKEFEVREPREGDEPELLRFVNELVAEDVPVLINQEQTIEDERKYLQGVIKDMGEGNKVQLLAFDGKKLVGNTQVHKDRWKADHVGVFGISIARDYRGQGLGEALARMVIEEAKKRLKVKIVRLDAFANNERALGLYKKLGFLECGRVPDGVQWRDGFVDRVYMYKVV